jgi:ribosomal protein L6P/L9E
LWYDAFCLQNSTLYKVNKLKKSNKNLKHLKINSVNKKTLKITTLNYIIPTQWNLILFYNLSKIQPTYFFKILSPIYFFYLPVLSNKNNFKFDFNSNQLSITTPYSNNFYGLYTKTLNFFYQTLNKPIFIKLNFKGKGYYIYKNYRNTITPQFGYSHRLYIYAFYLKVLFLSKTSLIVFGINHANISFITHKLRSWRAINVFTGRGIRFSKQIRYKKSGKVSTYR